MKKILILFIIMFSFFSKVNAQYDQLASSFQFIGIDGNVIDINKFKNQVIIVVNVASRCGFTNQYERSGKVF